MFLNIALVVLCVRAAVTQVYYFFGVAFYLSGINARIKNLVVQFCGTAGLFNVN